jgi:ABC-2 type transport system ATP-binding protein
VLRELDLVLAASSTTVLLGRNGCGKSTLARLLLGAERPDRGTIRVAGLDPLRNGKELRGRIGFVPDHPDVYDWMTTSDLYEFLRPQYPRWSTAIETRLVARWCIPEHTRFGELSRGEAAKAMFVAALAPQPDFYLLDEAFERLDPIVRDEVLAGFLEEVELDGRAALVVTHALDLAVRLADRVAVLADGRIDVCAEVEDVLREGSALR